MMEEKLFPMQRLNGDDTEAPLHLLEDGEEVGLDESGYMEQFEQIPGPAPYGTIGYAKGAGVSSSSRRGKGWWGAPVPMVVLVSLVLVTILALIGLLIVGGITAKNTMDPVANKMLTQTGELLFLTDLAVGLLVNGTQSVEFQEALTLLEEANKLLVDLNTDGVLNGTSALRARRSLSSASGSSHERPLPTHRFAYYVHKAGEFLDRGALLLEEVGVERVRVGMERVETLLGQVVEEDLVSEAHTLVENFNTLLRRLSSERLLQRVDAILTDIETNGLKITIGS